MEGRYKCTLSYLGTNYHGWQIQPETRTVQQTISDAISILHQKEIQITGCGRTDSGVHSKNFVGHFDLVLPNFEEEDFQHKLNRLLPKDIVIHHLDKVADGFHARFDAISRLYRYYITFEKNPFKTNTAFYFKQAHLCNWADVLGVADLLTSYEAFKPFCKSNSDAIHYKCQLAFSKWTITDDGAFFEIKANRFLRGMVRLIVGACLDVGLNKMTLNQLKESLDHQSPLFKSWSVPAEGLFLEEVLYK